MRTKISYFGSLIMAALRKGETPEKNKEALTNEVLAQAPRGDVDAAIKVIDDFGKRKSFLMNIGDDKGLLLDAAVQRARPKRLLELGAFCGYSGLRMARAMPEGAVLYSVEMSAVNAKVATEIWKHAGVDDRVTVVVGTLDDGVTLERLRAEFGFTPGSIDFVFVDHEHSCYLPDLRRLLEAGFLHSGTVVLADNVKFPGAPEYLAYMRKHEGREWKTVEHKTHLEYQPMVPDLVLESTYLGEGHTSL